MTKIGYARVSTAEQILDLQIQALEAAGCEAIFTDRGISALSRDRPAFGKALNRIGQGDTLVIWKMDRAFRSLTHALDTLAMLEQRGAAFEALTEKIDTDTALGRFVYQIRNAFAELERALISERTKAGINAARQQGVTLGKPPSLTPADVARAQAMRQDGLSYTRIGAALGVSRMTVSRIVKGQVDYSDAGYTRRPGRRRRLDPVFPPKTRRKPPP